MADSTNSTPTATPTATPLSTPTSKTATTTATTTATPTDAGTKDSRFYQQLPHWRFQLRQHCLPGVHAETAVLYRLQTQWRRPALDAFFAWSANLASHTFYVLMLPLPLWFGLSRLARDLVAVLGWGIYVSGFCKDLLCLPRPRSPPLARITMLSYTAHEYGWPLSHSANATAVTLVLAAQLWLLPVAAPVAALGGAALALYWATLIVGRLYCGMHGFFDVGAGAAIGAVVFAARHAAGAAYDRIVVRAPPHIAAPLLAAAHFVLVLAYPTPLDDCPCFDDSVAFVGVLLGLDLAHCWCAATGRFAEAPHFDPFLVPYVPRGVLNAAARVALGVALVAAWKAAAKPLLFALLPKLYRALGVLPPSHQNPRRLHLQLPDGPLDLDRVVHTVAAHDVVPVLCEPHPSGVFRSRHDPEIVGRLIVYAGIAIVAVWGFGVAAELVGV